jgi:2-iminobutanoate/2-iminopropanoate deaminase
MEHITTEKAPAAIGPYSQAIVSGSLVFVSGQLGVDPESGVLVEGFAAQAEQACANVAAILEAADLGFEAVVKTTCFLADMGDFSVFNGIYARRFTSDPARSCVEVGALPKGALVEIEVIAAQ